MKRCIFFLVLVCSFAQLLKAQNPDPLYVIDAYRKGFMLKNKDSVYYQQMFFKVFPSDFKTFSRYYGWDYQLNKGRPLTSTPPTYFKRVFNSKAYSRAEVIKKIIGISVNARRFNSASVSDGNGPAVGQFQEDSFKFALAHIDEFLKTLQTRSKAEIVSVWAFYMDYPNGNFRKGDYKKVCNLIAPHNPAMVALITQGYKRDVAKWSKKL